MTPSQQTLESARQGDPVAIAALINQPLQSKGITARVTRRDTCLKVLLEADQVPDQQALVTYLQKNLVRLKIPLINTVELLGKQSCAATPAWRQSFALPAVSVDQIPQMQPLATVSPAESSPVSISSKPEVGANFQAATSKSRARQAYQAIFSVVVALILVLIGANLRSAQLLLTKAPAPKKIALNSGIEGIYRAPIVSRMKGVPVIMVTFNGSYPYPMIVDTGAGGTLITQEMAANLAVKPVSQATAQTANGYTTFDVGYVDSIEVDGAKISNIPVAIGLSDMDVGLLGHDFFNNFDVTVRAKVVEFRPRKEEE
jgi:predicted aspartyl protease